MLLLLDSVVGRGSVVVGIKVGDPDGMVAGSSRAGVCRIDEKVVDTASEVLVDDDGAVCHETETGCQEVEVVTPCVEVEIGGEGVVGIGEETGGEGEDDGGDEGVM